MGLDGLRHFYWTGTSKGLKTWNISFYYFLSFRGGHFSIILRIFPFSLILIFCKYFKDTVAKIQTKLLGY